MSGNRILLLTSSVDDTWSILLMTLGWCPLNLVGALGHIQNSTEAPILHFENQTNSNPGKIVKSS